MSSIDEKMQARILYAADGNPGAITVLGQIYFQHESEIERVLSALAERNLRGSDIWLIYKQKCQQEIEKFLAFDFSEYKI